MFTAYSDCRPQLVPSNEMTRMLSNSLLFHADRLSSWISFAQYSCYFISSLPGFYSDFLDLSLEDAWRSFKRNRHRISPLLILLLRIVPHLLPATELKTIIIICELDSCDYFLFGWLRRQMVEGVYDTNR